MGWLNRWRKRLRALVRKDAVERELHEEIAFHLAMETEKHLRQGMSPNEAQRRAALAFGGVEKHKEGVRDARVLGWVPAMGLDFKLGFRLLVKYPALTIVGGFAMAFALAVGAMGREYMAIIAHPDLGLPESDRIVGLQLWNAAASIPERRALHDFFLWRTQLRSVVDVGAFTTSKRNLSTTIGGVGRPVAVAEMSASLFRVARVRPLLGRTLIPADEQPGAPPVVVIGHDLWQTRFDGDSTIIGRTVRVGIVPTTVVGVMPERFAFPILHNVWMPLPLDASYAPLAGAAINVAALLAPGATLATAQAELSALGHSASAEMPDIYRHLHPRVLPYAWSILATPNFAPMRLVDAMLAMVLVLVSATVAMLMFARAAARENELIVRSALGASRARLVAQLFAEAFVLGSVAVAVGLPTAATVLRGALTFMSAGGDSLPFWIQFHRGLAPSTLLYAGALTVLGALVSGVLPALRVTRDLRSRLGRASAGGGGYRFGGIWTAVIVSQVALTIAAPVSSVIVWRLAERARTRNVDLNGGEFLTARLSMDQPEQGGARADTSTAASIARFKTSYAELERRLGEDPAVVGVTFASALPGMTRTQRLIEVEGEVAATVRDSVAGKCGSRAPNHCAGSAWVALGYFTVLDAPVVAGRNFHSSDVATAARTVIVNRMFVDRILGGRNPLGRHVRYVTTGDSTRVEPWYEIVGVVRDLGEWDSQNAEQGAGLYHPVLPGTVYPVRIAVHVRGSPSSFEPGLRAAAAADQTLQVDAVQPLADIPVSAARLITFGLRVLLVLNSVALLLSLAGIYAVMSFTVARRTREIGIRVALGASAPGVVGAVFARPLTQVVIGVVLGSVLAAVEAVGIYDIPLSVGHVVLFVGYAMVALVICLLACVVPTARALRIQPTEALRTDG